MDIQNFSITPASAVTLTVPRFQISATVVEGGNTIADFTGANILTFPGVLASLSVADRRALIDMIATTIVQMKAGIYTQPE